MYGEPAGLFIFSTSDKRGGLLLAVLLSGCSLDSLGGGIFCSGCRSIAKDAAISEGD